MTLREEAERMTLDEYCQVTCKGEGRCCDPKQCEGYRQEVEYILREVFDKCLDRPESSI